ncbi:MULTISPECIES: hypothetical protein [Bacillus cereus group]|nr:MULTISPECIES: hypothetical protein [Bacillus cereus group]MEB8800092.1 hypothetical protein [Bacillus cereus]MEB8995516.1 hypothetical protein [Bacillus cereus]MEB9184396.1 hypothetical protein [Bacillus cereus]MEC3021745.1 hypothetical protein [Bacillus cereus]MEC3259734.1 hypothetical protein [Bacillus cereus]
MKSQGILKSFHNPNQCENTKGEIDETVTKMQQTIEEFNKSIET